VIALIALAVFVGAIALDYADSRNTLAVARGDAHGAARWSIAMYLLGLVGFFSILRVSPWLAIPECAGLYLGSWLAVRKHRTSVGVKSIACNDHTDGLPHESYGNPL
jgi:hypothetical protein